MNQRQTDKEWILRQVPKNISSGSIPGIEGFAGISQEIIRLLVYRGLTEETAIREFLTPSLSQMPRPHLMKGMAKATGILREALKQNRPVTVYGDFDADGVTATAVLYLFFRDLGLKTRFYVPDRLQEGYGLNDEAVRKLSESGIRQWNEPGILITADCGVSDVGAVETAKQLGFTVIITDHHRLPEELPPADVILNPLLPECDFPCKHLAGVGVAFFLILGLRSELMEKSHWPEAQIPNLKSYMDLVAVGTVADQVPITGCNRVIVKAGLEVFSLENRIGMQKLLDKARVQSADVKAEDIAFRLAPRINAIGRIDSAWKAVELLCDNLPENAAKLAFELEEANNNRKRIEAEIFAEATSMVAAESIKNLNSLLLYKKDWHQGVLGIVASRVAERYNRPTILLTEFGLENVGGYENLVKGSGRSIEGLDLHAAVFSCREFLERFGGHEGAVGLTLRRDNINLFRKRFDQAVGKQTVRNTQASTLVIDLVMTLDVLLDKKFLTTYALLAPFGNGNPEPVFCLTGQQLTKLRQVGGDHLRFTVADGDRHMDGIGFGFAGSIPAAKKSRMDIAFNLRFNSYMGQNKWEIYALALRPSAD